MANVNNSDMNLAGLRARLAKENFMHNPWLFAMVQFHRADTFRKLLPNLIGLALVTALIAWLEMGCMALSEAHPLKNITLMHGLLGFAISMLLVFRTNTAYDRWWEGRKLWSSLVTGCRNLAIKVEAFALPEDRETRQWFAQELTGYAQDMRRHLINESSDNQPLRRATNVARRLPQLCAEGKLPESRLFLLLQEVTLLVDLCASMERIRHTPIPTSYLLFIKKFIAAYTLTLPIGYAFSLGYLAIPVVVFIFYVLASLEMIAEQIEEPFGNDAPDLPIDALCQQIERDMGQILISA